VNGIGNGGVKALSVVLPQLIQLRRLDLRSMLFKRNYFFCGQEKKIEEKRRNIYTNRSDA